MDKDMGKNPSGMSLYQESECKTNRDNLICLIVLALIVMLCDFLNEVGIFEVSPMVMRIGAACGTLLYLFPVFILFRPAQLFQKNHRNYTYRKWHKYLIIMFAWLGTAATGIMLTHHTVVVMAIPIMIFAQYRDTRKLVPITLLFATVCVLLGVYGGYFFGCFDANLLHIAITEENATDLAMRFRMGTPERMVDLFTHYAVPRELVILALTFLAAKTSKRNNDMLSRQEALQTTIETEMKAKNDMQCQIINGMANLIENRDESTGEHVKRTSYYVQCILAKLKAKPEYAAQLTEKESDAIVRAAPLHDIGKIVVADQILRKPGKLTPQEYEEIKLHASEGAKVIKNVLGNIEDDDFLHTAEDIAGCHHERYDGKGYPNGLSGKEIPFSARVMAVADVFDALVSKRVYKEPFPPEEAFAIIQSESGKQFDPDVVEAFVSVMPQIIQYLSN